MPYDIRAADGIRVLLSDRHDVVERKMMGGLVFMVGGNMCVVVSGRGGLLVRVGPDVQARVLKEPHVTAHDHGWPADDRLRARRAGGLSDGGGLAQMGQARSGLCRDSAGQAGERSPARARR